MAYQLLKGKRGIIFGALDNKSIAWKVAERAFEEGAIFTLSNTPTALRFGELDELAAKCNATVIPADATSVADLTQVLRKVWKCWVARWTLCCTPSACRSTCAKTCLQRSEL